jgi:hypothetical protein
MSTPPSLADVLSQILSAIQTILYEVASAIADNAAIIATVVVIGALAYMTMKFGTRVFRGVTSWMRGMI